MPLRFAEPEKPTTSGDPRIPQGDPMIDVAIFGAAGSGKSSFIRKMTRQEDISIEGQFRSAADLVQEHAFSDNGTHFTLIELPGFGRHDLTDEEIFLGIADWFEKSHRRGLRLNQLLYFHRITGDRPSESDLKYLRMFKKLCGKTDYRNTILGLTCWDQEEDEIVEAREKAFKDTPEVWGDMIEEGMRIKRVPLERQKCIDIFLGQAKSGAIVLDIQHEMVHKEKPAYNTRAAKVMKSYESSQATRDVEKLEILTEQYRHEASVKKLRQKASVTTSEQEERFRELLAIQNADFDKLADQKEKGTMEQRDYAEVQNRRIACFEQQKLATISQEFSLNAERLELEREHANRLADLDNAKVCRWSLAHKESIIAQEKLLLLEKYKGTKGSRQDFEFIRDKYRDPRDRTHHQGFCDYCLDQLSLFDSFWECTICETPHDSLAICKTCRMAGKGCFDPDHTLEEYKENGWAWCPPLGNCLRARGVKDLFCNHCEKAPGSLYLHCCLCKNDDFDLCIDCWATKAATCLHPDEHGPLMVFARAPPEERYSIR